MPPPRRHRAPWAAVGHGVRAVAALAACVLPAAGLPAAPPPAARPPVPPPPARDAVLAIEHATVVDPLDAAVARDHPVLVRGRRIVAVGPARGALRGA